MFPRVGLAANFAIESFSPMVGGGVGCTYRVAECLSIFSDMAFQGITSEFFYTVATTGRDIGNQFNGFFDINLGVQWDLNFVK